MFRAAPALPDPYSYTTYGFRAPAGTHTKEASCEQVECEALKYGWETTVDEHTQLGQRQAHYVRDCSGRAFAETRLMTGLTVFTFPAGQRCFSVHRVDLGRPPSLIVRAGDWRVAPRWDQVTVHTRPEYWLEDFGENQQKLHDLVMRG